MGIFCGGAGCAGGSAIDLIWKSLYATCAGGFGICLDWASTHVICTCPIAFICSFIPSMFGTVLQECMILMAQMVI